MLARETRISRVQRQTPTPIPTRLSSRGCGWTRRSLPTGRHGAAAGRLLDRLRLRAHPASSCRLRRGTGCDIGRPMPWVVGIQVDLDGFHGSDDDGVFSVRLCGRVRTCDRGCASGGTSWTCSGKGSRTSPYVGHGAVSSTLHLRIFVSGAITRATRHGHHARGLRPYASRDRVCEAVERRTRSGTSERPRTEGSTT